MFESVGYTWNPITGCTGHECEYCWARKLAERYNRKFNPQFKKSYLKDKLPDDGKWIFIGSTGDVFCSGVKDEWMKKLFRAIRKYKGSNRFLFVTKNPLGYLYFLSELTELKEKVILGATIETNRETPWSKAPITIARYERLSTMREYDFDTFLSLEPISKFDHDVMKKWIHDINPIAMEIGKENYSNVVDDPSDEEIIHLCETISSLDIPYKLKRNLQHLENLISVSK